MTYRTTPSPSAISVHPAADIFPMLDEADARSLAESIAAEGLLHPLTVDAAGVLLDGRNRLKACQSLGIEPSFVVYEGDPVRFIIASNLERRHLTTSQRAMVAEALANLAEGRPSVTAQKCAVSQTEAASLLGVSRRSVQQAAEVKREAPDLAEKVAAGEMTLGAATQSDILRAAREIKSERRKERDRERAQQRADVLTTDHPLDGERFRVFVHDISEGPPDIAQPAAVITDPPYPEEYIGLYGDIDLAAAALLPDGGSLLAMCGQSHLPRIIATSGGSLRYQWSLNYYTPGQSTQVFGRHVKSNWKPVLWYVKGTYSGEHVDDTIRSGENDKRFHKWGQSVSGMAALIERFTVPGDLIYDPFCGGGTTGVAALLTGRLFVGSDIDEACVKQTAARLAEVTA